MKLYILPLLLSSAFSVSACGSNNGAKQEAATEQPDAVAAVSAADLNDLEIAHVAYTADNIDIRYAKIALKRSTNPDIHAFAKTMIRDHTKVNELVLALLAKIGAKAQDNFLSQKLNADAEGVAAKLNGLSGREFDLFYATNELGYHKAVNDLVENAFIPNIENTEVRKLFEAGLGIFKGHQEHAQAMVDVLEKKSTPTTAERSATTQVAAAGELKQAGQKARDGQQSSHRIAIGEMKFQTKSLDVRIGDKITWVNEDMVPHTATAKDKSWDSGLLKKGESFTLTIAENTALDYLCTFHPQMKGTLNREA